MSKNKRIFLIIMNCLLLAVLIGVLYIKFRQNNSISSNQKDNIGTIVIGKDDICQKIDASTVSKIFNNAYNRPTSTKSTISGSLASQSCSYSSLDKNNKKDVQIVVRYQSGQESKPTIDESWQAQKQQYQNNSTSANIGKESYLLNNPAQLNVFTGTAIIQVSANSDILQMQQIAKLMIN